MPPAHPTASIEPLHDDDHIRGPADAQLTIVEYGDYDCPHTRRAHSILTAVMARLPGPPRFVFRHFPLREMHRNAQFLSEVAEGAATQGKFWELHDRLMAHRRPVSREDLTRDVEGIGLSVATLEGVLAREDVRARIQRDVDSGCAAGVHSTPSFFFNGVLHDGHYDEATLSEKIDEGRRAGR